MDSIEALQAELAAAKAEAERSRRLLAAALSTLHEGIVLADSNGKLNYFNPAAEAILGMGKTDSAQDEWSAEYGTFYPDGKTPMPSERLPLVRALGGEEVRDETLFICNQAVPLGRFININASPLLDDAGVLQGAVASFQDVSSLKRLDEEEQRFRTLAETTNAVVWSTDASGAFVAPQVAWEGYTGQPWEQHQGFGWGEMIHEADRPEVQRLWQAAIEALTVYRSEGRLWHAASAAFRRFVAHAAPLTNPDGSLREWIGTITDIEELRVAQQLSQLNESMQRDRALIEAIRDAQSSYITEGKPLEIFDTLLTSLLKLTGSEYGFIDELDHDDKGQPYLTAKAITNIAWNEETRKLYPKFLTGELRFTKVESLFGAVMTTGKPVIANDAPRDPRRGGLPPGHPALNAFLGLPLRSGRDFVGVLGLANAEGGYSEETINYLEPMVSACANMIAALRNEARRKHADEEVRRLLESENRRVTAASRLKSEFLANMSHELRTPLNSIIGFAELMHDGEVGAVAPKQKEFLGDILTSGKHLLQLINDVLDLSKVEAGKLEFHPEPIELDRVFAEVLSILRTGVASKAIQVETSIASDLGEIVLDASRLKQVLYNYLSNALKFTDHGGSITLRALVEDSSSIRIEVEDTGIGIAANDLDRLFTEFLQLDASAAKVHGGTGLGLALTKRLVEAQGGTVGVRSEPGKGSLFYAVLPRRGEGQARPTFSMAGGMVSSGPEAPVVLVVEDDAGDQETIGRQLVDAGYAVEFATTGAEAITKCAERAYAAVTLDLILPDMGGLDVLRSVRASGKNPGCPIVVVTIVTEQATGGFAVHDVLSKPVDGRVLVGSLRRAGVEPAARGSILVVDDDESSLRLMATLLEQLGFRAICHPDGRVALGSIERERPIAIVLDLSMPGFDGFQFLAELRASPANAAIPVFVWTMKDLTNAELESLRASASTILRKAGGAAELTATLRGLLGGTKPRDQGGVPHGQ